MTPTTRWQVGGHRFFVRRLEHALVRRDTRMVDDPMRSRSRAVVVGAVLACLGLAACAVLAFLRPVDRIGDASIVVGKDSGALFVVRDGVLHPVFGLASARLILGRPDDPVVVAESELATRPRGALAGIPGAPASLPVSSATDDLTWSVCDTVADGAREVARTTVVVGAATAPGPQFAPVAPGDALLWSEAGITYLVYDGVRARVDPADYAVARALELGSATAAPVSAGLVNAVPEVPPVTAPAIPGIGEPTSYDLGGRPVGAVFTVRLDDRDQQYVALADGVQPISPAVARLLRFENSAGRLDVDVVAPDALRDVPESRRPLPVGSFPDTVPRIVDAESTPVACASWQDTTPSSEAADPASAADRSRTTVWSGRSIPIAEGERAVTLAGADGEGDGLDAVVMSAGSGYFVQTTGASVSSSRRDASFYLADTGVRFGIVDASAASALGLGEPIRAPWSIVGLFAPGPALGSADARVVHDGVAPDLEGAVLPVDASSGN